MVDVCAAIIQKDGKILIAKRAKDKSQGDKWEFPGGKLETGETPEMCLERELMEELTIEVRTDAFFMENVHSYEEVTIRLLAYFVEYISGEIKLVDHSQVQWVTVDEIREYDFAEADIPVVNRLMRQQIG